MKMLYSLRRVVSHDVNNVSRQTERCVFRQSYVRVPRVHEAAASLVLATHYQIRRLIGRQRRRDVIVVAMTTAAHDAPANHVPLKQFTTTETPLVEIGSGFDPTQTRPFFSGPEQLWKFHQNRIK